MSDNKGKGREPKQKPQQKPPQQVGPEQAGPEMVDAVSLADVQRAIDNPHTAGRKGLRGAQRAYGNQHVQRAIHHRRPWGGLQAKMQVNEPDDAFEKEADDVADTLQKTPAEPGSAGDDGGNENSVAAGGMAQREADAATTAEPDHAPTTANGHGPTSGALASMAAQTAPNTAVQTDALDDPEPVVEAAQSVVDIVPPVDGGSDGGDGDGGGDSGDSAASAQRTAETNGSNGHNPSTGPTEIVRRSVPTQLRGKLFQAVRSGTNGSSSNGGNRHAPIARDAAAPEAIEDADPAALDRATAEFVPPVGGPDGPPGDGDVDPSDAIQRDEMGLGFGGAERAVHNPVENTIDRKRGDGQKLPEPVQDRMERHMGHDFSGVRVHTDDTSDQLNRSLNAKAFTTGQDVFFSRGAYEPGSEGGQKLIAHELTHVVQQGAAGGSKNGTAGRKPITRRKPTVEQQQIGREERGLYRSAREAMATIQRMPAEGQAMAKPMVFRAVNVQYIQLKSKKEKAKEKAKKKAKRGQDVAESKADQASGKDKGSADKKEVRPAEPPKDQKLNKKGIEPVEAEESYNPSEVEPAMPEMDTGGLGWVDVKGDTLPDWDAEVTKFDAFNKGDYAALGLDLSSKEADTTGITVDDPDIRAQMVQDALEGGFPTTEEYDDKLGMITDVMPSTQDDLNTDKLFTEGPGAWFDGVKAEFGNDAKDVGAGFGDLFGGGTGSVFARLAGLMKALIGILRIVRRIVQIIRMVTDIFYWIIKLFVKLSKLPFIGWMFKWARPIIERILPFFSPMGAMVMALDLYIKVLRMWSIVFLSLDMMYFETDPDKLMKRQAELSEHVAGMRQSTRDKVNQGISDQYKEERDAEEGMIGAENLENPNVSPFSIQDVSGEEDQATKDDYKAKFLAEYGVDSVADEVSDDLVKKREEIPNPPLVEYGATPEDDVRRKVDRNAIAVMELERQKLGIKTKRREAERAQDVTRQQQESFDNLQKGVDQQKEGIQPHKADMQQKMSRQKDMQEKSQESQETGKEGKGQIDIATMSAKLLIKFIQIFVGPMMKAGTKVEKGSDEEMAGSTDHGQKSNEAGEKTSEQSEKLAKEREEKTSETHKEAQESEGELDDLHAELGGHKAKLQEGEEQLEEQKESMDTAVDTLEEKETQLIEERTEAINQAVNWMAEWRTARMEIFEEVEADLEQRYKDNDKEDDAEEEADVFDDAFEDETEGNYLSDDFKKEDDGFDDL